MKSHSQSELRKFGLSVGGVFLLIGGLCFYLEKELYWIAVAIGALLVFFGAVNPRSLNATFYWWMKFAEKLSVVTTFIILTLTFFLVMLPIGILLKIIRKDILSLKLDKTATTYWITVKDEERAEKYITPY